MNEIKIQRSDGVQSTYKINNPETWNLLDAKPRKPRTISDKRKYPKTMSAFMSTRDYVIAYYELNGFVNREGATRAYVDSFFQPLNTTPATWAPDTVEIEIVECAA